MVAEQRVSWAEQEFKTLDLGALLMAPSSQVMETPGFPGRFTLEPDPVLPWHAFRLSMGEAMWAHLPCLVSNTLWVDGVGVLLPSRLAASSRLHGTKGNPGWDDALCSGNGFAGDMRQVRRENLTWLS